MTEEGGYRDFRILFASLYVETAVIRLYERDTKQKLMDFIRTSEGDQSFTSPRGYIFESLAHRLIAGGGSFKVCLPFLQALIMRGMLIDLIRFVGWQLRNRKRSL